MGCSGSRWGGGEVIWVEMEAEADAIGVGDAADINGALPFQGLGERRRLAHLDGNGVGRVQGSVKQRLEKAGQAQGLRRKVGFCAAVEPELEAEHSGFGWRGVDHSVEDIAPECTHGVVFHGVGEDGDRVAGEEVAGVQAMQIVLGDGADKSLAVEVAGVTFKAV